MVFCSLLCQGSKRVRKPAANRAIRSRLILSKLLRQDWQPAPSGPLHANQFVKGRRWQRQMPTVEATPSDARHPRWTPIFAFRLKVSPEPTSARRYGKPSPLSGRYEGGVSVFCCHGDGRLHFGQTASTSSGQYRRGRGLLVRELANEQEIMVAEGQVPPDELAAYALEELRNSGSACRSVARARLAVRSPHAAPPSSVMNSRRFN